MAQKDIPFTVELIPEGKEDSKAPDRSEEREAGSGRPSPRDIPVPEEKAVPQEKAWSVTQLTRRIRGLLEESFPVAAVEGELSNVRGAASGHWYFNLKDEKAQVRCVMFRSAASSLRFALEDGMQVLIRGRISVFEARGEYQIQVLTLEPRGVGALQLAFEQLKQKLATEGLFELAHKQPLPYLPRCIGIVTSPRGAAIRDMLNVLERRFASLPVLIAPAVVQGDAAAGEIAAAIDILNRLAPTRKIDVIIVGRGGGSVEDLWAFNEEVVARAIFHSKVPVISAVGHEVDYTIADFVADLRAPTPSAAAELAVPVRDDLRAVVEELRGTLFSRVERMSEWNRERWAALRARLPSPEDAVRQMAQRVDDLRERIQTIGRVKQEQAVQRHRHAQARLLMARPDRLHKHRREVLTDWEGRLSVAMGAQLERLRGRLAGVAGVLSSLSPLVVLERGYATVTTMDGTLVRGTKDVRQGDALRVGLHDGVLDTEVVGVGPHRKQD